MQELRANLSTWSDSLSVSKALVEAHGVGTVVESAGILAILAELPVRASSSCRDCIHSLRMCLTSSTSITHFLAITLVRPQCLSGQPRWSTICPQTMLKKKIWGSRRVSNPICRLLWRRIAQFFGRVQSKERSFLFQSEPSSTRF